MKAFLLKLFCFAILLFCVDRIVGYAFSYMSDHAKGGYVGHHMYITDRCQDEILIFGSSRAVHHYDAKMISDSLGVSCYNCGQDGNGIILNYGNWTLLKRRYKPRLIIYDVTPEFDFYKGDDNHKYLGWLKMSYNNDGIPEIFETIDKTELVKMESMMYRYNYNPLEIISDYVHPLYSTDAFGFDPIDQELDKMKLKEQKKTDVIDSIKIAYLERLIKEASDQSRIVFVVSPYWYGMDTNRLVPLKDLCGKYNVQLIDYSNDKDYVHCDVYFADGAHLNLAGAEKFTHSLLKTIKLD